MIYNSLYNNDTIHQQSLDFYFNFWEKSRNGVYLVEVRQPNSVVENPIGIVVVGVGTSNDTYDGEVLTVSTGESVDNAEPDRQS